MFREDSPALRPVQCMICPGHHCVYTTVMSLITVLLSAMVENHRRCILCCLPSVHMDSSLDGDLKILKIIHFIQMIDEAID